MILNSNDNSSSDNILNNTPVSDVFVINIPRADIAQDQMMILDDYRPFDSIIRSPVIENNIPNLNNSLFNFSLYNRSNNDPSINSLNSNLDMTEYFKMNFDFIFDFFDRVENSDLIFNNVFLFLVFYK